MLVVVGMREADSLLNLTEHSSDVAASSLQQNGSPQPPQASVLESIADYSPDWSYTEVYRLLFRAFYWIIKHDNYDVKKSTCGL